MKIAFAGSRNLAIELINWVHSNKDEFGIDIVGGVAPPFKSWWDDKVDNLYRTLGIPVYSKIEDMIEASKPDIVFSINYWRIISSDILSKVKKGIINIHHSYKLRFRGRYSTSWAIIHARNDNNWWHGTTLHFIDDKLDNGKIIATEKCPIYENDTADILFERVEQLAVEMFKDNFSNVLNGEFNYIEKDSIHFYYDINSNKNLEVKLNSKVEDIYDFVRAWSFKDRPKPYFLFEKDKKIYLSI